MCSGGDWILQVLQPSESPNAELVFFACTMGMCCSMKAEIATNLAEVGFGKGKSITASIRTMCFALEFAIRLSIQRFLHGTQMVSGNHGASGTEDRLPISH